MNFQNPPYPSDSLKIKNNVKTEKYSPNSGMPLHHLRLKYFQPHKSRSGNYDLLKIYIDDEDNNKTYCLRFTKAVFKKLLAEIMMDEEWDENQ
jgi:hypothetical protein